MENFVESCKSVYLGIIYVWLWQKNSTYSWVKSFCINRLLVIYTLATSTPFLTLYACISKFHIRETYNIQVLCVRFYKLVFSEDGECNVATFMPESEEVGGACAYDGKKGNWDIWMCSCARKSHKNWHSWEPQQSNTLNSYTIPWKSTAERASRRIFSFFVQTLYMHVATTESW